MIWNDITFANKENLLRTLWQDKNKISWIFLHLTFPQPWTKKCFSNFSPTVETGDYYLTWRIK